MGSPGHELEDLYALPPDAVKEPPATLAGTVRQIGPGLILAASIVGTGELINTTGLGAKAGFALLWLILLSCVIKVFVQVELGRYAITHGKTTLAAFDTLPGPKLGTSWICWLWLTHDAHHSGPDRSDGGDRRPGGAHGVSPGSRGPWPTRPAALVPDMGFISGHQGRNTSGRDSRRWRRCCSCSRAAIAVSR